MGNRKEVNKKGIVNGVLLLFIVLLLLRVFGKDYREIADRLSRLSPAGLILILGAGVVCQLLDAAVFHTVIHRNQLSFPYGSALTVTLLTVFANVTTSGIGSIPLQSFYLYRHGMPVGSGIGAMTLEYALHKTTVFFYAAVAMCIKGPWLCDTIPGLGAYLLPGFIINGVIITALILACTCEKVKQLLLWLPEKLPNTQKWEKRRAEWKHNLTCLYEETGRLLHSPSCCTQVLALNICKLTWMYLIPWLSMRVLGIGGPEATQVLSLSAAMLLITGAIPNVAGVGPMEFAFLMLFTPYIGSAQACSALVLYRVATYFLPFLMSLFVFWKVRRCLSAPG